MTHLFLRFITRTLIDQPHKERVAEDERRRQEEEAVLAAAEAARLEVEEKAAAARREREAERAADLEKARLQLEREEAAEARNRARVTEKPVPVRKPIVVSPPSGIKAANGGEVAWRRGTPVNSVPATPTRADTTGHANTPPRSESPTPAALKYRPGALGGGGGGWRAREEARNVATVGRTAGTASPRPASPAPPAPKEEPLRVDDDGFQTVPEKKGPWRRKGQR